MDMGREDAHLDRDQLRDVTLDDEELMREVVSALIDDTSRQMQLLKDAIQDQDATRCMHLAHYSKGACANVGAAAAAGILKDIERRAANHEFSACDMALAQLAEEVEALRSEVGSL
jgi:HPt (histidine-containing phosphotransfer) domain-containing protein